MQLEFNFDDEKSFVDLCYWKTPNKVKIPCFGIRVVYERDGKYYVKFRGSYHHISEFKNPVLV